MEREFCITIKARYTYYVNNNGILGRYKHITSEELSKGIKEDWRVERGKEFKHMEYDILHHFEFIEFGRGEEIITTLSYSERVDLISWLEDRL